MELYELWQIGCEEITEDRTTTPVVDDDEYIEWN